MKLAKDVNTTIMWVAALLYFFGHLGMSAGGGGNITTSTQTTGGLSTEPTETTESTLVETTEQPSFDNATKRDYTAAVGQPAYLHCRVKNLGDRQVSWIRKRDLHILTVGLHTYSSDARFAALHTDSSDEWTLRVAPAQPRDSGAYECQVSTEPKISLPFRLTVVVSKAEILSGPELFVRAGSDINLTCIARHAPDPPSFIYWYRGTNVVNYAQRGGISVETEQRTRTSRLLIARASPRDSGNYTCAPSSSGALAIAVVLWFNSERALLPVVSPDDDDDGLLRPPRRKKLGWGGDTCILFADTTRLDSASVVVHVVSGERPAAMQSATSHATFSIYTISLTLAFLTLQSERDNRIANFAPR